MTKEEVKFWNIVRAKRFHGLKFKRQVLVAEYIVDFLCQEKMCIVEIDGGQHNNLANQENDEIRTRYLESCGYKVLRFWNNEIWDNIDGVYAVLEQELLS